METRVVSPQAIVLQHLVQSIQALKNKPEQLYSQLVEFSLAELVRVRMRQIAAAPQDSAQLLRMLERSLEQVQQQVEEQLEWQGFEWQPYLRSVSQSLKEPAREMRRLGIRLLQDQHQQKGQKEQSQFVSLRKVPFQVSEVGVLPALEGLIAFPLLEVCEVDLKLEEGGYRVRGVRFPFEVWVKGWEVVLDEDGSLYVGVERLPQELVAEAREVLVQLAEQLYVQAA
jgi:hypothetical protein